MNEYMTGVKAGLEKNRGNREKAFSSPPVKG